MSADLAGQLGLRIAAALDQPALEALVVHRAHIASAATWLDEGLRLVGVVANPAILLVQKRLALLGRQLVGVGI